VLALRKNITRTATLVTEQPTILVSITKSSFLEVTNKHELTIQLEDRPDILRSFPIFSGWEKKLNTMAVYFERKKFKRGEMIFKEANQAEGFYLII
jgi:CRP-like cAMP-binding protein